MDPDPCRGGPKTYESYGSGSATLVDVLYSRMKLINMKPKTPDGIVQDFKTAPVGVVQ
jgi:hypothetical protein